MKRVLIFYVSAGHGHTVAALALTAAIKQRQSEFQVTCCDILELAPRLFQRLCGGGYATLSRYWPGLWGWLFNLFNDKRRQAWLVSLAGRYLHQPLLEVIRQDQPDLIITTHPLASLLIARSADAAIIAIPSAVVITDYGCHSSWVDPLVDFYFVPTASVGQCVGGYGIPTNRIIVSGIPIDARFSQAVSRSSALANLGLTADRLTLLIVGGQVSPGVISQLIGALDRLAVTCQVIVVAGHDRVLDRAVRQRPLTSRLPVKVFGFVENMAELMTAADVVISKAGGLIVSECLAKGLPMIIPNVIPGQEEDNLAYLLSQGVAVRAPTVVAMVTAIQRWVKHPAQLQLVQRRCRQLARPRAATTIADFIWNFLKKSD